MKHIVILSAAKDLAVSPVPHRGGKTTAGSFAALRMT
jgi:hypothetical protein